MGTFGMLSRQTCVGGLRFDCMLVGTDVKEDGFFIISGLTAPSITPDKLSYSFTQFQDASYQWQVKILLKEMVG